jgi:ketosteroid isomerase-like protein
MPRPATVLCAAALAALGGCGSGVTPEDEVRAAVEGYAKAFAARDYQALCDRWFDRKLVTGLEQAGLPCEAAIRPKVSTTRKPTLEIRRIAIDGDTAKVDVHTTAQGEPPADDTLALVKGDDGWRLTTGGATAPEPATP